MESVANIQMDDGVFSQDDSMQCSDIFTNDSRDASSVASRIDENEVLFRQLVSQELADLSASHWANVAELFFRSRYGTSVLLHQWDGGTEPDFSSFSSHFMLDCDAPNAKRTRPNDLETSRADRPLLNGEKTTTCPTFGTSNCVPTTFGNTHDSMSQDINSSALHEARVVQRIAQLRKEGLWSEGRLPKVSEPSRSKAHWDYLLDEMQWMAQDFTRERLFKMRLARKLSRDVLRYHHEKVSRMTRAGKDEASRLRRLASNVAREIKQFWSNLEKIAQFRQDCYSEEKRRKVLGLQLNTIVEATEKLSSDVAKRLHEAVGSTISPSPAPSRTTHSDEDDEETIAREETLAEAEKPMGAGYQDEISALQADVDLPIEELLQLYPGYLEQVQVEAGALLSGQQPSGDTSMSSSTEDSHSGDSDTESDPTAVAATPSRLTNCSEVSGKSSYQVVTEERLDSFAATAEELQPKGFTLSTATVCTPVPFFLKHSLREYQHIGLDWLVTLYEKQINGILADEMGLGKTIQTIALLAHLACSKGVWGPHLVVVPTSVLLNWEQEFKKWCPAFKILTYYGTLKERRLKRQGWSKQNAFHICITSYTLVLQDHKAFRRKKWVYLVLDEAQNIKNFKSQRWQLLLHFNTQRRLLLTGTPLQNNLMELWSLMHFLMPQFFSSHQDFREWFSSPLTGMIEGSQDYNDIVIRRLHKVLRPFLLRRLKSDVETQMPRKYEHTVRCRLSKRQRFLYDDFMARSSTKETLESGNMLSVINVLMQLRKVCNHPDLFEPRPVLSPLVIQGIELVVPSLAINISDSGPFSTTSMVQRLHGLTSEGISASPASLQRTVELLATADMIRSSVVSKLSNVGHDTTDVDVMADLERLPFTPIDMCLPRLFLENYAVLKHSVYYQDVSAVLQHRVEGCIARITAVSQSRQPVVMECSIPAHCTSLSRIARLQVQSMHAQGWPMSLATPTTNEVIDNLQDSIHRFIFCVPKVLCPAATLHASHQSPSSLHAWDHFRSTLNHALRKPAAVLHPVWSRMTLVLPELRLIQYDCGKLQVLDQLLNRLKVQQHRVLIFTQMTRVLDILESFLSYHGLIYLRLDGSTKIEHRQVLVERFNRDSRIFCFILSTRSGGLGINLVGADTVIFYDSDWNPTMDSQAQDRCHRIGQTRDVHIYRFVCERTVEENIVKKAYQKRLLCDLAIEGGCFNTASLKESSIKDLFSVEEAVGNDVKEVDVCTRSEPTPVNRTVLEQALCAVEDKEDAVVMTTENEGSADYEEFSESAPSYCDALREIDDKITSQLEEKFAALESELTPVERYALRLLECETQSESSRFLVTKDTMNTTKRSWQVDQLIALHESCAVASSPVDAAPFCYERGAEAFTSEWANEEMMIWKPPSPPPESEDNGRSIAFGDFLCSDPIANHHVFVDLDMLDLYESDWMDASEVPYYQHLSQNGHVEYTTRGGYARPLRVGSNSSYRSAPFTPVTIFSRKSSDLAARKLRRFKQKSRGETPSSSTHSVLSSLTFLPEWSPLEDLMLLLGCSVLVDADEDVPLPSVSTLNWALVQLYISKVSLHPRTAEMCQQRFTTLLGLNDGKTVPFLECFRNVLQQLETAAEQGSFSTESFLASQNKELFQCLEAAIQSKRTVSSEVSPRAPLGELPDFCNNLSYLRPKAIPTKDISMKDEKTTPGQSIPSQAAVVMSGNLIGSRPPLQGLQLRVPSIATLPGGNVAALRASFTASVAQALASQNVSKAKLSLVAGQGQTGQTLQLPTSLPCGTRVMQLTSSGLLSAVASSMAAGTSTPLFITTSSNFSNASSQGLPPRITVSFSPSAGPGLTGLSVSGSRPVGGQQLLVVHQKPVGSTSVQAGATLLPSLSTSSPGTPSAHPTQGPPTTTVMTSTSASSSKVGAGSRQRDKHPPSRHQQQNAASRLHGQHQQSVATTQPQQLILPASTPSQAVVNVVTLNAGQPLPAFQTLTTTSVAPVLSAGTVHSGNVNLMAAPITAHKGSTVGSQGTLASQTLSQHQHKHLLLQLQRQANPQSRAQLQNVINTTTLTAPQLQQALRQNKLNQQHLQLSFQRQQIQHLRVPQPTQLGAAHTPVLQPQPSVSSQQAPLPSPVQILASVSGGGVGSGGQLGAALQSAQKIQPTSLPQVRPASADISSHPSGQSRTAMPAGVPTHQQPAFSVVQSLSNQQIIIKSNLFPSGTPVSLSSGGQPIQIIGSRTGQGSFSPSTSFAITVSQPSQQLQAAVIAQLHNTRPGSSQQTKFRLTAPTKVVSLGSTTPVTVGTADVAPLQSLDSEEAKHSVQVPPAAISVGLSPTAAAAATVVPVSSVTFAGSLSSPMTTSAVSSAPAVAVAAGSVVSGTVSGAAAPATSVALTVPLAPSSTPVLSGASVLATPESLAAQTTRLTRS